jgi:hypothetical protein
VGATVSIYEEPAAASRAVAVRFRQVAKREAVWGVSHRRIIAADSTNEHLGYLRDAFDRSGGLSEASASRTLRSWILAAGEPDLRPMRFVAHMATPLPRQDDRAQDESPRRVELQRDPLHERHPVRVASIAFRSGARVNNVRWFTATPHSESRGMIRTQAWPDRFSAIAIERLALTLSGRLRGSASHGQPETR